MKPSTDEFTRVSRGGHFVIGRGFGFEATEMRIIEKTPGNWSGRITFNNSRLEDILNAEREGTSLEMVRARWGVSPEEFACLRQLCTENKRSVVQRLMMRTLAGVAADTELGGGNGMMGKSDYTKARNFALAIVPEALVDELMSRMLRDTRQEAAGPLRVAILTAAERLRRRRHFDTAARAKLWHEVCPGPWYGLGKIQADGAE